MRKAKLHLQCAVALAVCVGAAAYGQVSPNIGPKQPAPTPPSVNLTMDNKHVLRENLLKGTALKRESDRGELKPGSIVPASVQFHAFPAEISGKISTVRAYEFFLTEDAIIIVEPQERKVVEIIEAKG